MITVEDFQKSDYVATKHFYERWNDRIGRSKKWKMENYIRKCAFKSDGIVHQDKDFYLLDGDIVIIVVKKNKKLHIVSTFGRVSKNPFLTNLKGMKHIYKKYGKVEICK